MGVIIDDENGRFRMIRKQPLLRRHFVFQHPLFRATKTDTGVKWQDSIYYFWWEFLRRHDGYKATCERGGGGQFGSLYEDFGNVHQVDFKTWWNEEGRGARLFAEPAVLSTVSELLPSDVDLLRDGWDTGSQIIVAIPLSFPKRAIYKRVRSIVEKKNKRRRGQRLMKESKALYPISAQFSVHSLRTVLRVYDFALSRPDLKQWEIAQQLRFTTTLNADELARGQSDKSADKKATMSVAVSRKLAHAKRIIEAVGRGKFPVR